MAAEQGDEEEEFEARVRHADAAGGGKEEQRFARRSAARPMTRGRARWRTRRPPALVRIFRALALPSSSSSMPKWPAPAWPPSARRARQSAANFGGLTSGRCSAASVGSSSSVDGIAAQWQRRVEELVRWVCSEIATSATTPRALVELACQARLSPIAALRTHARDDEPKRHHTISHKRSRSKLRRRSRSMPSFRRYTARRTRPRPATTTTPRQLPAAPPDPAAEDARRQQLYERRGRRHLVRNLLLLYPIPRMTEAARRPGDVAEAASLAATPTPRVDYPIADGLPAEVLAEEGIGNRWRALRSRASATARCCRRRRRARRRRAPASSSATAPASARAPARGVVLDNGRAAARSTCGSARAGPAARRGRPARFGLPRRGIHDGAQELDRGTLGLGMAKGLKEGVLFSTYATLVTERRAEAEGQVAAAAARRLVRRRCRRRAFVRRVPQGMNYTGKEGRRRRCRRRCSSCSGCCRARARRLLLGDGRVGALEHGVHGAAVRSWGPSSAFKSSTNFVRDKGAAASRRREERVAMEMKSSGMYAEALALVGDYVGMHGTQCSPFTHYPTVLALLRTLFFLPPPFLRSLVRAERRRASS